MEKDRLSSELADLRAEMSAAKSAIEQSLAEPIGRWKRLAQFFNPAQEDRFRSTLRSWASRVATVQPLVRPAMSSSLATALKNPYLRADSLRELLSWNDIDFVRCAYVTILGRQPDVDGEIYYTDRIRSGHSKMGVLWQLRRSPEGGDHDPGIAGLDKMLRRHHNATRPLFGLIIRALTGREGDTAIERQFRSLKNYLATAGHEQMVTIATIQHQLEHHSAELENHSVKLDAIHTDSQAIGKSVLELHAPWANRDELQGLPEQAKVLTPDPVPECPPSLGPTTARLYKKIKLLAVAGDGPMKCAL